MQNTREHIDTNDIIEILILNIMIAMMFTRKKAHPISLRWKSLKSLDPLLTDTLLQSEFLIRPQIFWVVSDSISKYSKYSKVEKNKPMLLNTNSTTEFKLCQKLLMKPKKNREIMAIMIVKYFVINKLRSYFFRLW